MRNKHTGGTNASQVALSVNARLRRCSPGGVSGAAADGSGRDLDSSGGSPGLIDESDEGALGGGAGGLGSLGAGANDGA